MGCPDPDTLQALVDNELTVEKRREVVEHVRSCESCLDELRHLLIITKGVGMAVNGDPCPSDTELTLYASVKAGEDLTRQIKGHLERCEACQSLVEFMTADAETRQAREDLARAEFEDALIEERARLAASAAMEELLPGRAPLFNQLWDKAVELTRDLRGLSPDAWPNFRVGHQLAGALGFTSAPDAEVTAASVILATSLVATSHAAHTEGGMSHEELSAVCLDYARRFGAGRELAARLAETLPQRLER
jgi:anti-sigma factor RsiW